MQTQRQLGAHETFPKKHPNTEMVQTPGLPLLTAGSWLLARSCTEEHGNLLLRSTFVTTSNSRTKTTLNQKLLTAVGMGGNG